VANDPNDLFGHRRVMAILRGLPPGETVRLANTAWDAGIDLVEVPIGTPDAMAALVATIGAGRRRGMTVGAGTVLTAEQLRIAAVAGAAFTVAPGLDAEVCSASARLGLPHLPGVATASEVQSALRLGLTWLKVFPANALGTSWFTTMSGPFPYVNFVATGGIDAANAANYLAAGAQMVGIGSALADPDQIPLLAKVARAARPDR
jgi:2-dehydro-3-deoxyphosphogluconate aldolase/(4S)-4-hydroxy-2-oxoglutarate aldolase